ncbi:MAG: hypothetical protein ACXWWK_01975 [Gemmatimonadales bacterium]
MADLAASGSQRWLQLAVNVQRPLVEEPLVGSLGSGSHSPLEWLCPLHSGGYREYKDLDVLKALGAPLSVQHSLADFWPRRGPVWDGLARSAGGDLLLLEAKAHIPELASGRTPAAPESVTKITERLREVRELLAPKSTADWAHTFYPYANRLAFLYFLRHVNQLPAHLVFVYFVNARDVRGPASRVEWESALSLMYAALGLPRRHVLSPFIHNIFIDAGELARSAA